jgi:hypothetical protein
MKKANSILSNILHLPQFSTLKSHYCYQKFISILTPQLQKAIAFVYIRQDTLFVALLHPGFKMELNYKKDLLKTLLNMLAKQDKRCRDLKVSRVILFNSKNSTFVKKEIREDTVPYYDEMAFGEFEIDSSDKELIEAFEKIRDSIENHF